VRQSSLPWTIVIFMVVSDDTLHPWALIDLRDIQRIKATTGFNVIVEVRWHNAPPERLELRDGQLSPLPWQEVSDDRPPAATLQAFLEAAHNDYPADHFLVMLWGHSYGCGFGRSEAERISYTELSEVFGALQKRRAGRKLEILACSTCRVGKVEAVFELDRSVRYLVASQVGVPYQAWPMHAVLNDLVLQPSIEPARLASQMVTQFCDWYRKQTVTMTVLDLDGAASVVHRIQALCQTLLVEALLIPEELRRLHDAFVRAANDDELAEPAVDVVELCEQLLATTESAAVRRETAALLEVVRSPAFIAKHDGTGPGAGRLHGVGVYVPHVGLDERPSVFKALGLQHARMWTEATSHLREADRHASLLAAIDLFEAELQQPESPQPEPVAGSASSS
jgi:Clostripain family